VEVTTLSRDGNQQLDKGTLLLIDNQISQASGTAKLKATFDNAKNNLWPGQYVNARVLVRTDRNALTLPSVAVQRGPNGPFTYVVKSDSTVEARPLEIGEDSQGLTIIKKGLQPNERVVTSNQYRLQPGAHVRTADSTAPASKASKPS
jgi:multidrug efflux system membrane fusion protein